MKTTRIIISLVLAFSALASSAQDSGPVTVKGKVVDEEGQPLVGATVYIEHSKTGTSTDDSGKYSLQAKPADVITVAYIGYVTASQKVGDRGVINFRLKEDRTMLEDVVVIGYGAVKKADLTGSVSSVAMSDLKTAPAYSVDNALQGRIAGAEIMSTSGAPGATTTIRIRGTRSISASNEPLIVVDGIMDAVSDLNDINTDDIASISVLKDASSTAIYGSRGSNGVIIITTKHGQGIPKKPNITFKADVGVSTLPSKLDIMNASEFAIYRNELATNGYDVYNREVGPNTPLSELPYPDPLSYKGTDWIDEITRTAVYQNYALSVSGSEEKSNYYVSLSYNDTQGLIKSSGQKRFTGRINLERQLFKWMKVGYKGSYTWRYIDQTKASIGGTYWWRAAQFLDPFIKPSDDINPLYYGGQKFNTPTALVNMNTYYRQTDATNHSFTVDITPVKNLHVNSIFSYFLYQAHTFLYYPGTLPIKTEAEGGEAYRGEYGEYSLSSETTLSYKLEKKGHSFVPMLGFSAYKEVGKNFTLEGLGYMDDTVKWNNMNAVLDKETYSASTSYYRKDKISGFARFDYNYGSRYYLTVTGRFDGASNFAANNKWAFFPSAAIRWNASNEKFLKDVKWIDDLSVRASAGVTGNDAISSYMSMAALSTTTGGYLFNGSQPVAYYRSRLASPNLTWEKTTLYNVALDVALFKQRLNVTLELYSSKTTDLLLYKAVPTQTGYSKIFGNIGETSNKGIELTINTLNVKTKSFQWSTDFTISHNSQMVNNIGSDEFVSVYDSPGNNQYMMYGYVAGYPLNSLWGFKYGGTWKSEEEMERNKTTKAYATTTPVLGGPRYYDIDHNGTLDQNDLIYQGNADPVLYGGFQNNFYYKGFKLGVFFNYSLGGKIYNFAEFFMAGSSLTNQYRYMLNCWHATRNPNSDIPAAGAKSDTALPSDFMIHDASYIRLKNVSLSYTFDLSKKKAWLKDITLTLAGENLYLWKNYNGFDPDVNSSGTSSTMRRVDDGAYPKARTIMFSLQVRY